MGAKIVQGEDGFRGGLERLVGGYLTDHAIEYRYEPGNILYQVPARDARYKPDFVLANGIILETKGRFVTKDRQKMLLIKQQHPDLDIRFIFSNPNNRISKRSSTTYGMWCDRQGFPYAHVKAVDEWAPWLTEEGSDAAIEAVHALIQS